MDRAPQQKANKIESFDIVGFIGFLIRYWYLFVIFLVGFGAYGYYTLRYTVPQYSTYSKVLVKDEYSSWGQEYFLEGMELISSRNRLTNEIGIIRSFKVVQRTLAELDFRVFYYDIGQFKNTEMYKRSPFTVEIHPDHNGQNLRGMFFYVKVENGLIKISRNKDKVDEDRVLNVDKWVDLNGLKVKFNLTEHYQPGYTDNKLLGFSINDLNSLAKVYQRRIVIMTEPVESSILKMSITGSVIEKEADFLNHLMDVYVLSGLEEDNKLASGTIDFVDQQLEIISDSLVKTEGMIQSFKRNTNQDKIQLESELYIPQSNDIVGQQLETQFKLDYFKHTLSLLEADQDTAIIIPTIIELSTNDVLYKQLQQLADMYSTKSRLEREVTEQAESYIELMTNMKIVKDIVVNNLKHVLRKPSLRLTSIRRS